MHEIRSVLLAVVGTLLVLAGVVLFAHAANVFIYTMSAGSLGPRPGNPSLEVSMLLGTLFMAGGIVIFLFAGVIHLFPRRQPPAPPTEKPQEGEQGQGEG